MMQDAPKDLVMALPISPADKEMDIARTAITDLETARIVDPQATIDFLFWRKELYKKASMRHYERANSFNAEMKKVRQTNSRQRNQIKSLKTKILHLEKRYRTESNMRKVWMIACGITSLGLATVLIAALVISRMISPSGATVENNLPKVPTSSRLQHTPSYILASVNIYNGTLQGSGTVISQGTKHALIVSAAHNFIGNIGGNFWVYYPDGSYTEGTLLAVDRKRDLALARVSADSIIECAYVPEKMVEGQLSGVGYTKGQGPNLKRLKYSGAHYNASKKYMWNLNVLGGTFWDGDSGGGIFVDNALVGVTSQRDAVLEGRANNLYACSHSELVAFLNENKQNDIECGDWRVVRAASTTPSNLPPLWKPNSNVPIYVQDRTQKTISELRTDVEGLKKTVVTLKPQDNSQSISELRKDVESLKGSISTLKNPENDIFFGLKKPSEVNEDAGLKHLSEVK